jgi:pimeloyl-ACP methyl ester carboxylesterase
MLASLFFALLVVSADPPKTTVPDSKAGPAGLWMGSIEIQTIKLRLIFEIKAKDDGGYSATLDSLDQGAYGIPVSSIEAKENEVKIGMKNLLAEFAGKREGDKYVGRFKQGPVSLPLVLERIAKRPDMARPQDPRKPYPYSEREVTYVNSAAKPPVKFAGTLTAPTSGKPAAAVILITGSGAQNRNEELLNHRPFLVLADHLTRKGIAVLRVDDRGVGGSEAGNKGATSADFATDVWAGIEFLKKEFPGVKVGACGHSEGGLIAPMVAAAHPGGVDFLVLLAGTGLPGDEILKLQGGLIMKAMGVAQDRIDGNRKLQEVMFKIVKEEADDAAATAKLKKAVAELAPSLPDETKAGLKNEKEVEGQLKVVLNPWMRYFISFDPRPTLKKVDCPVLAVCGEKDLQVPPKENLAAIKDALVAGGNKNVVVREFKGLNHLFQNCRTGAPNEYGTIAETFAPSALTVVSDWILETASK